MKVPLIKGRKVSVETDYRDAIPVNMIAIPERILNAPGYMLCYPGLVSFATGLGIDRGGVYNERFSNHFRVSGTRLISVSSTGSITDLGAIPGTAQVAMPYSFNTQAIIGNNSMYLYDATIGFREVVDPHLGNPIDGVWVDNYYFLTDGENIYHTDVADESSIDPLKFATAEFMPDPSLGLGKTRDNKVIVFGRFSTEYFVNNSSANFSFQRVETRAQKIGIVATHAKCESPDGWYLTGGHRDEAISVHLLGVGGSDKVSTREIDDILAQYTEPQLSDIRMECRSEKDISLIIIHLPNETLCYNRTAAEKFGHEYAWSILKTMTNTSEEYGGINGIFDSRLSEWVYGDKLSTKIGKLDNTVFTYYGAIEEWYLYSPLLKLETMSVDELEMETLPGNASDADATVAFSITQDGITYSMEWFQLYGQNLDRGQRFIMRRLGYVRDWIGFKFRGATKSRMSFAQLNITTG
jgi:hypothetical protein